MGFEISDQVRALNAQLQHFMDEHIYPRERDWHEWCHDPEHLWEVLPEGVSVTATRWPAFSASGFAVGGTLTLQLEDWTRQVRVSPVGRIYQP